jgi:hypothetical protein
MFNPKKWWLCIPDYNDPEFIKKRDLIKDHYLVIENLAIKTNEKSKEKLNAK